MIYDLQKASILKRIAAGIFDFILTAIIAVGVMWLLSAIFNYDGMSERVNAHYDYYSAEYQIDFREINEDDYNSFTDDEKEYYREIYNKLATDEKFLKDYNLMINFTLVMVSMGLLLGVLIIEFVIPLILKDGQTIGKKCFSICLMQQNGVKVKTFSLLVRSLLGKFTIETMIPCYILIMIFFGSANLFHIFVLIGLYLIQLVLIITNRYNNLIHDSISYMVVVDKESQMIFESEDALIKYKEELASKEEVKKRTF